MRALKLNRGFTLVELLVVIGVLAILATVVLLAVNPGEQLARARDADRISAVAQLGRVLQKYYVSRGSFQGVDHGRSWMNGLSGAGEINFPPKNPKFKEVLTPIEETPCLDWDSFGQNGYCFKKSGMHQEAIVFARMESSKNRKKCHATINHKAFVIFSTWDGKAGIACTNNSLQPEDPAQPADPPTSNLNWTWAPD
jgi:prepilin-type N-terminal cleavage/methylation domain-containing protein